MSGVQTSRPGAQTARESYSQSRCVRTELRASCAGNAQKAG